MNKEIWSTVAYLAIGAVQSLDRAYRSDTEQHEALSCRFGGQMGIVAEVVQFADVVESVWDARTPEQEDAFTGVWFYDVVECIGDTIINNLLAGETINADEVREMTRERFEEMCETHDETTHETLDPRDHMELLKATLENVMLHFEDRMSEEDRKQRWKVINETADVLAKMAD